MVPMRRMSTRSRAQIAGTSIFLAILSVTLSSGQQLRPRSEPTKGFDPRSVPRKTPKAVSTTSDAFKVNPASPINFLPQHGNVNGGLDHGYSNMGVVFGARIYSGHLAEAIELFYYIPSDSDNFYREGDYRASTGRIGGNGGTDNGEYYCPEGYAAVGLQGASGLAIDRVGLVCGQIGDLSKVVALPIFGGNGGNAFYDNCAGTRSLGFLTGVRVRSGAWMDSIQGLCQAAASGESEAPAVQAKPMAKLADDRAASIAVGADRSEVLQKLGEPYSKISGDVERFTYQLQSGGTLRIELEDGRVTKVESTGAR
jgi:hypothetical protein